MNFLEKAKRALSEYQQTKSTEAVSLQAVMKDRAIELYLVNGDRLFIVADEEDARRLNQPRGAVYTAGEVERVIQIGDPETVADVHRWKREFNGIITNCRNHKRGGL